MWKRHIAVTPIMPPTNSPIIKPVMFFLLSMCFRCLFTFSHGDRQRPCSVVLIIHSLGADEAPALVPALPKIRVINALLAKLKAAGLMTADDEEPEETNTVGE